MHRNFFQKQADEAWPEDQYHVIHKDRKNYGYNGHTFIMTVGDYWVFTPYDDSRLSKEKAGKPSNGKVKKKEETW